MKIARALVVSVAVSVLAGCSALAPYPTYPRMAGLGEEARADFEERLVAVRRTALSLEMHEPRTARGRWAGLATTLREGWPPWRVLQIVRAWVRTPRLADELAGRFRPRARFVVIGHTHFAGVWGRGGRVVVNTGSFLPLSGRYAVRIDPDQLEVRKVERRKGEWVLGRRVAAHDWRGSPRGDR